MNHDTIEQLKKKCPQMAAFFDNNPKLAKQQIFHGFLEHDEYRHMFIQAVCFPNHDAFQALNEAFKDHYANVQFTHYLSKTLYWTSVQYDQRRREQRDNQRLMADNLHETETIYYPCIDIPDIITETSDLGTWSEDVELTNALRRLTDNQQLVIIERYGHERTNNEIARLLNVSPQAVSRTHAHALKRLRTILQRKWENDA
ncbi:sigma-70 family RNA polymerase sigma factor [Salicibibacter cibarius]|uniref:Sigma-70 family RNA polymerase sigma factor n=1 Tax=Salicibibacter cibarius TaxID=2743000 RepID=A0A7T7CD16_9BACI|nr:sigma-70 family RNA polymerase sigma factor [Salicibibacter cibarius]QQK77549.1 sigma-70 family RNA polymerase sigma factor [Salicibibacter cibarius]